MVAKSDDYPFNMSDEDLLKTIKEHIDEGLGVNRYGRVPTHQDTQFFFQLAQVGQVEYSNRIQRRFADETIELKNEITSLKQSNDRYSMKSGKQTRLIIFLSIITIFLAATTIWFSKRDMESDQTWRDDQMTELKKNNELLEEQIRVEKEVSLKLDAVITDPAADDQAEPNRDQIK